MPASCAFLRRFAGERHDATRADRCSGHPGGCGSVTVSLLGVRPPASHGGRATPLTVAEALGRAHGRRASSHRGRQLEDDQAVNADGDLVAGSTAGWLST